MFLLLFLFLRLRPLLLLLLLPKLNDRHSQHRNRLPLNCAKGKIDKFGAKASAAIVSQLLEEVRCTDEAH